MHLLGKGDRGVVVGDLARGARVARRQRDAVVDVENSGGAARRPDDGSRRDLVLLSVYLAISPDPTSVDRGPRGGLIYV